MINSVFIQVLMFTSSGTVKQNMQTISLPYHSGGSVSKKLWMKHNVVIFHLGMTSVNDLTVFVLLFIHTVGDINIFHASSFHILLQTSFGLQIQVQHVPVMQVYVRLEQSYKAKTRGEFCICLNMKHHKTYVRKQ